MTLFGNETELFFICYGEGANGKPVFADIIKSIFQNIVNGGHNIRAYYTSTSYIKFRE